MFDFDIILVSWNRLEYLKRTIASLISSGAVQDCQRFIIVDNGSTEVGLKTFLSEIAHDYRAFLIIKPENRGWGQAVNDALGLSRAPYVLLSNNDVEYKKEFHRRAGQIFDQQNFKDIGILGVWRHTAHGLGLISNPYFQEMDNVPAVGWFLKKSSMERAGMLPEHGPCFTKGGNGEDTLYVQKMKELGLLVGVPPEDIATHIDGY